MSSRVHTRGIGVTRRRASPPRARSKITPRIPVGLSLVLTFAAGCTSAPPPPAPPEPQTQVGPAPLRRLTDVEYHHALGDLFPQVLVELPTMPADAVVGGFDNAAQAQAPSDVRIARYETIASRYAEAMTADADAVRALTGCPTWEEPRVALACAGEFLAHFGRLVFRRPLDASEHARLLTAFRTWQSQAGFEVAVRLSVSAMLQLPQFLYRPEPLPEALDAGAVVPVEPYALASRLSFFLWQSVPDAVLLEAAERGELATEAQVRAQAERLVNDPKATRVLWELHRQWLGVDRLLWEEHQVRTPQVDPAWNVVTQRAAHEESKRLVEQVLGRGGTLAELLTTDEAWVNGEVARVYGVPIDGDPNAWRPVRLPASQRAGFLTRLAFLAGNSHRGATSPPVRGSAIQLRLLCRLPTPPPDDADLSQPTAAPDAGATTNRMRFAERTKPAACQACHRGLDGLGFGLEPYGAAGAWQTVEEGLPIDARGEVLGTDVDGPFEGGVALSQRLARSREVHDCAVSSWVRFALGRAPAPVETAWLGELSRRFSEQGGVVKSLLVDLATAPSFRLRQVEAE